MKITAPGMAGYLAAALMSLCCLKSDAGKMPIERQPIHVFVKAVCPSSLGSEVVTTLRDAIRNSPGYQIAKDMTDSGSYGVVLTINLTCTERNQLVSVASILGRGSCSAGSCYSDIDTSTLQSTLCGGTGVRSCGHDIYTGLDEYMTGYGGEVFNEAVRLKRKSTGT